ncbi:ABC transporter ATP-binding protein [Kribbella sp. NPDC006257]|uniref:ABC transporter ATP-binding protein n=1 Tax=Kribbella sp. NPDC006257 TaxID=3156738 RepID=UPI0033B4F743
MNVILDIRRLTRQHGTDDQAVHALRGVDLAVAAGELVAVMGPSGSGKSTLLTCAGGLDQPTSGEILIDGNDITTLSRNAVAALRRRRIGYVFQDFNLIPALTAVENVALPLELDGARARTARKYAEAALLEVAIPELADRFPEDMSGGQRQRIAIARAIVGDRRILLADEPTGALDSGTGEAVLQLLRDRCDQHGIAGVLVTHDARHAAWADRVVYLRDGVLVGQAGPLPDADVLLTAP